MSSLFPSLEPSNPSLLRLKTNDPDAYYHAIMNSKLEYSESSLSIQSRIRIDEDYENAGNSEYPSWYVGVTNEGNSQGPKGSSSGPKGSSSGLKGNSQGQKGNSQVSIHHLREQDDPNKQNVYEMKKVQKGNKMKQNLGEAKIPLLARLFSNKKNIREKKKYNEVEQPVARKLIGRHYNIEQTNMMIPKEKKYKNNKLPPISNSSKTDRNQCSTDRKQCSTDRKPSISLHEPVSNNKVQPITRDRILSVSGNHIVLRQNENRLIKLMTFRDVRSFKKVQNIFAEDGIYGNN